MDIGTSTDVSPCSKRNSHDTDVVEGADTRYTRTIAVNVAEVPVDAFDSFGVVVLFRVLELEDSRGEPVALMEFYDGTSSHATDGGLYNLLVSLATVGANVVDLKIFTSVPGLAVVDGETAAERMEQLERS